MTAIRVVRPSAHGWVVAISEVGGAIAVHTDRATALHQAKDDLRRTGGVLRLIGEDGAVTMHRLFRGSPSPWFDLLVPFLLLMVPGIVASILGSLAPAVFAPAVLASNGTVWGVALATFVLSSSAAVVTTVVFLGRPSVTVLQLLGLAALTLLLANVIAFVVGTGSLDFWRFRPSWFMNSPWPVVDVEIIVLFLIAGVVTYGIGGALLGIVSGIVAGWRFAAWLADRMAV